MELLTQSPFDPKRERRIVIVTDWLPPDFGAVGQYMQMRAEALADRGHLVTLIGLTSGATSECSEARGEGTLTVIRLASGAVPRGSLLRRLLWTVSTDTRLLAVAFRHLRAADGILFTGSPPFLVHLLAPLKPLWRGRLVYRITDFHPECLIAAQDRPSRSLGFLLAITNFWRRRIDGFEVLGRDQLKRLEDVGVPTGRINVVRDGSPVSFEGAVHPEPLPPSLIGSYVLLYAGNYGVAHEVETVAAGYERHHRCGTGRVRLWLSATGAGADELARRFQERRLPFHRSTPVPLDRLPGLLRAADAHLVTLRDSFVGFVMPSKIYACIGSGKPVLFVGSADSDVDLLARPRPAGYWRVACGDPERLAIILEQMADTGASKSRLSSPTAP